MDTKLDCEVEAEAAADMVVRGEEIQSTPRSARFAPAKVNLPELTVKPFFRPKAVGRGPEGGSIKGSIQDFATNFAARSRCACDDVACSSTEFTARLQVARNSQSTFSLDRTRSLQRPNTPPYISRILSKSRTTQHRRIRTQQKQHDPQ